MAGETRRGPVLIEAPEPAPEGLTPETAPPLPEPGLPDTAAMTRATVLSASPRSWAARLFWGAATGLLGLWLSVTAWDFVLGLADRNLWLGRAAAVFGAIVALGVGLFVLRELFGLARLARVDRLRAMAEAALRDGDRTMALAVATAVAALQSGRPEGAEARRRLERSLPDTPDADAVLALAERELLALPDAEALRRIEASARRVAVVTALMPIAFADVLAALGSNVAMIRAIAEAYGARSGTLGSWRLLRAVAAHLVATGAVAVTDDMLGAVLGGGALTRLSRRFGEGVINGALTARVGVAAMEVCRPMPFVALPRPRAGAILGRALAGFVART